MSAAEILAAINLRMNGGHCPTGGSLGECAAISLGAGDDGSRHYVASLYLWKAAAGLTAAEVAGWFTEAGALTPVISRVLHDPFNDTVEGVTEDGACHWEVIFWLPASMQTRAVEKAAVQIELRTAQAANVALAEALRLMLRKNPDALSWLTTSDVRQVEDALALAEKPAPEPLEFELIATPPADPLREAAPDLLASCKDLIGLAEREGWIHMAINSARAAIAKAEGWPA